MPTPPDTFGVYLSVKASFTLSGNQVKAAVIGLALQITSKILKVGLSTLPTSGVT